MLAEWQSLTLPRRHLAPVKPGSPERAQASVRSAPELPASPYTRTFPILSADDINSQYA